MLLSNFKRQNFGFTLVELLIVIAIIGIISSAAVVNLNQAKAKARDARRLSDIAQIRKALEIYNYSEGAYPGAQCTGLTSLVSCLAWSNNPQWIPNLDPMPLDPLTTTVDGVNYYYLYQMIDGNPQNHYLLLYNLETEPRRDECGGLGYSPYFSCVQVGAL